MHGDGEWKAIDPIAARDAIEAAALSPAEKASLLNQLGQRGRK